MTWMWLKKRENLNKGSFILDGSWKYLVHSSDEKNSKVNVWKLLIKRFELSYPLIICNSQVKSDIILK